MSDVGLTHVALPVKSVARSEAFYARFAAMRAVHRRVDQTTGRAVVWLSDGTRPFVIVLIEADQVEALKPIAHLGVGLASRARVDALVAEAHQDGVEVYGPRDEGGPVGYFVFLRDPDGHTLEISYGQEVGLTVAQARAGASHA